MSVSHFRLLIQRDIWDITLFQVWGEHLGTLDFSTMGQVGLMSSSYVTKGRRMFPALPFVYIFVNFFIWRLQIFWRITCVEIVILWNHSLVPKIAGVTMPTTESTPELAQAWSLYCFLFTLTRFHPWYNVMEHGAFLLTHLLLIWLLSVKYFFSWNSRWKTLDKKSWRLLFYHSSKLARHGHYKWRQHCSVDSKN